MTASLESRVEREQIPSEIKLRGTDFIPIVGYFLYRARTRYYRQNRTFISDPKWEQRWEVEDRLGKLADYNIIFATAVVSAYILSQGGEQPQYYGGSGGAIS